ncbi:MAG: NAD-dependent deacylase [Brooklawnia sp.]|jgi:NAD-dependent deacetylase
MNQTPEVPDEVVELARGARKLTVLTGAGMSAESGVPTFRDAQTGLWAEYDPAELATPEAWQRDRALVWAWYQWRRRLVTDCAPNPGHHALAEWAALADLRIVTQNVDDLHERAGSRVLGHLHGSLFEFRCDTCGQAVPAPALPEVVQPGGRTEPPGCPGCDGHVRPGVVWFGEPLPQDQFNDGVDSVVESDLVLAVGSSGIVQPAALLPDMARRAGIPVVEINVEPTPLSDRANHVWLVPAGLGLSALVANLTG